MVRNKLALAIALLWAGYAQAQVPGQFPAGTIYGNSGASTALGSVTTMTLLFDRAYCATNGQILQRGASAWGCISLSFSNLSGSLASTQTPAYTGDVTSSAGATVNTLANIPNATPMAGDLLATNIAVPGTPAAGKSFVYVDSTNKVLSVKTDVPTVSNTVVPSTAAANSFATAISAAGVVTYTQPTLANISNVASGANNQVTVYTGTNAIGGTANHTISTGTMTHGVAGSVVGSSAYANATTGTITLTPVTGALASTVLTLPVRTATATIATTTGTLTNGNCTKVGDASGNMVDAGIACYATWTTAGRPGSPTAGVMGYNSTLGLVEYYDGTNWTAVRSAMSHQKYIVANWYLSETSGVAGTGAAAAASTIVCTYDEIITPVTINALGTNITTLVASGNFQLALYSQGTNGRPATLLGSTASISTGTAGAFNAAVTSVQVGLGTTNGKDIWFCQNRDTTGASVVLSSKSPAGPVMGRIGSATQNNVGNVAAASQGISCAGAACQGGSSTFATWPASLGTSTWTDAAVNTAPRVVFKVASSP